MLASPCLFHYHLHSIEHHGTLHIKKHKRIDKEMRRFITYLFIYFWMCYEFMILFTHTMYVCVCVCERERERDYVLQSTVGSRGTGTSTLQSWGSCFSLSGII